MIRIPGIITTVLATVFFSTACFSQGPKKIKTIIVDAGHGGHDGGAHGAYEGGLKSWEKNVTLAISLKLVAELKKQFPDVKVVPTRTTDIYQSPPEKANIANENKGDLFICIHADAVDLKSGRRQVDTRQEIRHSTYYVGKGKKRKKMIKSYNVTVPVYEYYKIGSQRSGTSVWLFAAHKTSEVLKSIMNNEEIEIQSSEDSAYNSIDFSLPENRPIASLYAKRYFTKSVMLADLVNEEVDKTDRPALGINQRQKGIWVLQATKMPAILVETGFITNYKDERYLNSDKGQQELAECITKAVKKYKDQVEKPVAETDQKAADVAETAETPAYEARERSVTKRITVSQPEFKVDLYDDGDVDGDIVSVYYNGQAVVSKKKLTEKPVTLNLKLDDSKTENELVVYAENQGDIPPNTALMIVAEGSNRTEVRISSDEKKNGVVLFSKK